MERWTQFQGEKYGTPVRCCKNATLLWQICDTCVEVPQDFPSLWTIKMNYVRVPGVFTTLNPSSLILVRKVLRLMPSKFAALI